VVCRRCHRTCETVGYTDVLAIVRAQKDTDHSAFRSLDYRPVVVIDNGKKNERGNGDVPCDERQSLCGGGRHDRGVFVASLGRLGRLRGG